jgi:hypothetical protein
MGGLSNRLPAAVAVWLINEVPACRVLPRRGSKEVRRRSEIRHARRGHLQRNGKGEPVVAGERVLDVQPKLGARVRLLASGDTNKNDPNDARSVAIAALRSGACRPVRPDDHATVLKVWAKRHRDLGRTRTQVVCRLHAVLCEMVPGGVSKRITAAHAARVLEQVTVSGAVAQARQDLADGFLDDLRRIDTQMRETRKRLTAAVQASGTTLTEIFGVGPVIAAIVIGETGDTDRFTGYPGAGTGASNHAVHMAAVTQVNPGDQILT